MSGTMTAIFEAKKEIPVVTQITRKEEVYASIWRRFCAGVFDALLASLILLLATVLLVWVMEAYHSEIGLSEVKSRNGDGHVGGSAVDRVLRPLLRQR